MAIKVLHLIDSGGLYGAEVMLLSLVEEQLKQGLKPLILSSGNPGIKDKQLEIEARKRNLPVKIIRMNSGLNVVKAFKIVIFAKDNGFDILHSHGYKFNILLNLIPKFIRKIPLVTTLHGYVGANRLSWLKLYQTLESVLLKYVDGIVYVSGQTKNNPLLRRLKARDEIIIYNGIDQSDVIKLSQSENSVSLMDLFPGNREDLIVIGAIGRLSPEKAFDKLIGVFTILSSKYPELRLVIIGEGGLRKKLENIINGTGLQGKVKLPGYINPPYRLISDLDGVVISSLSEGLPMTLLEVCALRKRIVATSVGSIPDVLSNYSSSVIVPPGDKEALEQAIENMIINKVGNIRCEESDLPSEFTSAQMTENYSMYYKHIVETRA